MCKGIGKTVVFINDYSGMFCNFSVRSDANASIFSHRDIVLEGRAQNSPLSPANASNNSQAHAMLHCVQLLTCMFILLFSNLALASGASSSGHVNQSNRLKQLNTDNDAAQSGGDAEETSNDLPSQSREPSATANDDDSDNVNARSRQSNSDNDSNWQSRGNEDSQNGLSSESKGSSAQGNSADDN